MPQFFPRLPVTRRTLLPLLLALGLSVAPLVQAETMTWFLVEFPPSSMVLDGTLGPGINDGTLRLITQHWTGVKHNYVSANSNRIWLMLASGEKFCYVGALRSKEREKIAYMANIQLVPPQKLIVRTDAIEKLPVNAAGEVNLPILFAAKDLSGLLVSRRSYGPYIDNAIAARPADSHAQLTAPPNLGSHFFAMLDRGRADYTIDYDFTLDYHRAQDPVTLRSIKSVPIEGNHAMLTNTVACPRTPWGRQSIIKIDKIISELAAAPVFRVSLDERLNPETRQKYTQQMNAFYLQRRKPSDPAEFR